MTLLAKEFEGELWVKATDYQRAIAEAERVATNDTSTKRVYETPEKVHEQEPVAFLMGYDKTISAFELERQPDWVKALWSESAPLYTRSQAHEWQGLTDEEMHECWGDPLTPLGMKCARAIETKLKEKNT